MPVKHTIQLTSSQRKLMAKTIYDFEVGLLYFKDAARRFPIVKVSFSSKGIVWGSPDDLANVDGTSFSMHFAQVAGGEGITARELALTMFSGLVKENSVDALRKCFKLAIDFERHGYNEALTGLFSQAGGQLADSVEFWLSMMIQAKANVRG